PLSLLLSRPLPRPRPRSALLPYTTLFRSAGSLGGGGRYDNLVGMFLGHDVPACGFSLGMERIIVVMIERGMFPAGLESAPADVIDLKSTRLNSGHCPSSHVVFRLAKINDS